MGIIQMFDTLNPGAIEQIRMKMSAESCTSLVTALKYPFSNQAEGSTELPLGSQNDLAVIGNVN
jgi:hypothetical protein